MLFQSDKLEFLFEFFTIKHQRFCLIEKTVLREKQR